MTTTRRLGLLACVSALATIGFAAGPIAASEDPSRQPAPRRAATAPVADPAAEACDLAIDSTARQLRDGDVADRVHAGAAAGRYPALRAYARTLAETAARARGARGTQREADALAQLMSIHDGFVGMCRAARIT